MFFMKHNFRFFVLFELEMQKVGKHPDFIRFLNFKLSLLLYNLLYMYIKIYLTKHEVHITYCKNKLFLNLDDRNNIKT